MNELYFTLPPLAAVLVLLRIHHVSKQRQAQRARWEGALRRIVDRDQLEHEIEEARR